MEVVVGGMWSGVGLDRGGMWWCGVVWCDKHAT